MQFCQIGLLKHKKYQYHCQKPKFVKGQKLHIANSFKSGFKKINSYSVQFVLCPDFRSFDLICFTSSTEYFKGGGEKYWRGWSFRFSKCQASHEIKKKNPLRMS